MIMDIQTKSRTKVKSIFLLQKIMILDGVRTEIALKY